MIHRMWKDHIFPRGKRKGASELFVVEPRQRDGVYLVKKLGAKGNRDEVYEPVASLDEVWSLLQTGRAVRMRGQTSGDWSTLNADGIKYA